MKFISSILRLQIIGLLVSLFLLACQKDDLNITNSGRLAYSTDTITFDTIFTTIGSVTKRFKVYNLNDQSIKINDVYLEGGSSSNYRINIDGESDVSFEDIVIPPNDSVYVFVEVTLDVNGGNLPLVVRDGIIFNSNANSDKIELEAFGQDVHLIKDFSIAQTQTWINDKPYLILEGLIVDTNQVLTIEEGVKVHFHHNASLYIWGSIVVNGTKDNPVVFEGDRYDRGYDRSAGRWGTIYIDPISPGNVINYAEIINPSVGIWIGREGVIDQTAQLTLSNTKIQNSIVAHVLAFGAQIDAYNCVFGDSRDYSLGLFMGGRYNFYQCTSSKQGAFYVDAGLFENYERGAANESWGLALSNYWNFYAKQENGDIVLVTAIKPLEEANFYNSVFWGYQQNEFKLLEHSEAGFNYFLDHCVLKVHEDSIDISDTEHFRNIILNEYPNFVNDSATNGPLDLQLDTLSIAKDAGDPNLIIQQPFLEFDILEKSRLTDGKPDLGAYERFE